MRTATQGLVYTGKADSDLEITSLASPVLGIIRTANLPSFTQRRDQFINWLGVAERGATLGWEEMRLGIEFQAMLPALLTMIGNNKIGASPVSPSSEEGEDTFHIRFKNGWFATTGHTLSEISYQGIHDQFDSRTVSLTNPEQLSNVGVDLHWYLEKHTAPGEDQADRSKMCEMILYDQENSELKVAHAYVAGGKLSGDNAIAHTDFLKEQYQGLLPELATGATA